MNELLSSLRSEPQMRVEINRPPYNVRWLSLLENSDVGGLRFKDQILHHSAYLGFSHRANKLGLKGPDNIHADSVICGTSFATGVGVDQGSNWYELNDVYADHFNIGFPVSTSDHLRRLEHLYRGTFGRLIYIYHPNVWFTGIVFQKARERGIGIFESMGWDRMENQRFQYPRYLMRRGVKRIAGQYRTARVDGADFSLNSKYCLVDDRKCSDYLKREMEDLSRLFKLFKSVMVIRVPIKEEVFSDQNGVFSEQRGQISNLWNEFYERMSCENVVDLSSKFEPCHYHQFDNHWNKVGNHHFTSLMSELTD